ncbi:MAG: hypothetical protein ABJQ70_09845 [Roseobacter sp.]
MTNSDNTAKKQGLVKPSENISKKVEQEKIIAQLESKSLDLDVEDFLGGNADSSLTDGEEANRKPDENLVHKDVQLQGRQQEGLLSGEDKGSLASSIDAVLEDRNLQDDDRQALSHAFAQKVIEAEAKPKSDVQMPDTPPEMWKAGQGETALEFLDRVYGPQVEARLLTYTWLEEHDPKLKTTVRIAGSRANLDRNNLPVTKQEEIDAEYSRIREQVGADVFDRILQLERTMIKRKTRANSMDSDASTNGI